MEYIHIEHLNKTSNYDTLLGMKGEDLILVDNININVEDLDEIEDRLAAVEKELEGVNNILASI